MKPSFISFMGPLWFFLCIVSGAILLGYLTREHLKFIALVYPLYYLCWVGVIFVGRHALNKLVKKIKSPA